MIINAEAAPPAVSPREQTPELGQSHFHCLFASFRNFMHIHNIQRIDFMYLWANDDFRAVHFQPILCHGPRGNVKGA